ncbi:Protein bric-a-brac 1 [Amphibalanus amphitrite]|uniref:Protein bric-a-brac 1 n=1 Tax=Amphibalanus amphitrite TaxID=1232801 RepID=A0A6A4VXS4_AMPAM|nr:Protein bric-a-brac 1 [Amphibalanus amphitrite]
MSTEARNLQNRHFNDRMEEDQHFCLKWNNYQSNMTAVFDQLRENEAFVDVTLACEGSQLKAHKFEEH